MLIMTMTGLSGLTEMAIRLIDAIVVISSYLMKTFESHQEDDGALL